MPNISDVTKIVLEIVADVVNRPAKDLTLQGNLFMDYGLDSVGTIAIMVELCTTFGVPEPTNADEYRALDTVQKLVNYVCCHT